MEDLLTKYGTEIDLVVTQDGGMFQGAYAAIEASGYLGEMGILCQGQDLIVREKLESGELFASVAQDPFTEGTLAVEMLDKLIKGEEVDHWTYTPTGPIYAEDVDNFSWFLIRFPSGRFLRKRRRSAQANPAARRCIQRDGMDRRPNRRSFLRTFCEEEPPARRVRTPAAP